MPTNEFPTRDREASASRAPERILVFETSALLGALQHFTDPHTNAPVALETLLERLPGQRAPVDRVVIPDHVLYELTGLMPFSQKDMLRKLADARNDPARLEEVIQLYAMASPRGEVNDPTGMQKNHVRVLLRFIAKHPESLQATGISQKYGARLAASYNSLSMNGPLLDQYCPTFADAFHYLGEDFHSGALRLHVGQLRMMGLLSEKEYNERLDKPETPLSKHQRFFKKEELLDRLQHKTKKRDEDSRLPRFDASLIERIRKQHKNDDEYVTVDFLRSNYGGIILRRTRENYGNKAIRAARYAVDQEEWLQRALGPSRLMMEHYCFGGILPEGTAPLLVTAQALGFTTSHLGAGSDPDEVRHQLYEQGFFEMTPNKQQLQAVATALQAARIDAPVLNRFLGRMPEAAAEHQARFRQACGQSIAYEKTFTDALVNGAMEWGEFWKLVQATDGMRHRYGERDEYFGTANADILVKPGPTPESTEILFSQKGFTGRRRDRNEESAVTRHSGFIHGAKPLVIDGRKQSYIKLSAAELLERCRTGRGTHELYRLFESMLHLHAMNDPVDLRNEAHAILGNERLVQFEKDFANRIARRSGKNEPPYLNLFAGLHVNGRLMRKNLGEAATLEAAATQLEAHPDAHVWLVNHDSDLFPTRKDRGDIQLDRAVVRQHAGLMPELRQLNARVAGNSRLHFVSTASQFLDDLSRRLGLEPRGTYEQVKTKPFIAEHRSRSWADTVSPDMVPARQR